MTTRIRRAAVAVLVAVGALLLGLAGPGPASTPRPTTGQPGGYTIEGNALVDQQGNRWLRECVHFWTGETRTRLNPRIGCEVYDDPTTPWADWVTVLKLVGIGNDIGCLSGEERTRRPLWYDRMGSICQAKPTETTGG